MRKLVFRRRAMVTSLSKPPRALSSAGVDGLPDGHVDIVGAEPLQHRSASRPLHQKFGERGHVEDRDCFAAARCSRPHRVEPVLAAEANSDRRRRRSAAKIVRPLPAHLRAEDGALRGEPVIERRTAERARAFELAVRPGHRVVQAERLRDAVLQPCARCRGTRAKRRMSTGHRSSVGSPLDDPFGERAPGAAGAGDAHRVEAGADEEFRAVPAPRRG